MMPAIGWLFHGDPETYLYIPESLERYPAQRGVEKLMQEAGFTNVALRKPPPGNDGDQHRPDPSLRPRFM